MKEILKKLNACKESIEWVGDKTIEQAINECPRGDWMLWLFQKVCPGDLQLLTLAKGHCANIVRHLMTDERSIKAVDVAIAFGEGRATKEELSDAAAYAAAYAADAAADAAYAAASAAYAASAAAYAAYAADAAAYAADAAASAAAPRKENRLQTADICRKYLGKKLSKRLKEVNND